MGKLGFHGLYLLSLGAAWFAGGASIPPAPENREPAEVSHSILSPRSSAAPATTASGSLADAVADFEKGELDLEGFVRDWAESDPLGAIESLTQGEDCGPIMRWIVMEWGRAAPDEASRWVEEQQGAMHYDFAVEGLLSPPSDLSRSDPERALRLMRSVECEGVIASLWSSYSAFNIMRQDLDLAKAALSESGMPASLQELVEEQWAILWERKIGLTVKDFRDFIDLGEPDAFSFRPGEEPTKFSYSILSVREAEAVLEQFSPTGFYTERVLELLNLDRGPFKPVLGLSAREFSREFRALGYERF